MSRQLKRGDVLLLINLQRDFFAGGAVPVPGADDIVPLVNEWLAVARAGDIPVVVTRDWHPVDHVSFVERGGTQLAHCVRDTPGAAFHPDLRLPPDVIVVSTGTGPDAEPVSAFDGTDLAPRLRDMDARRLWIAGVPLDESVRATALEALRREFEVEVIAAASRSRASTPQGDAATVLEDLQRAGAFVGGRHLPEMHEASA